VQQSVHIIHPSVKIQPGPGRLNFSGRRLPPPPGQAGAIGRTIADSVKYRNDRKRKKRKAKNIHAKKISARFFNKAPDVASAITDIKEDFSARERYFRSFAAR
jgi:hypothetical protein